MPDIVVRLRTPSGMTRHSVSPDTPLSSLPGIFSLPGGTPLSLSPSGSPALSGATVASAGVTHGAIVYAKLPVPAPSEPPQQQPTEVPMSDQPPSSGARSCVHPPSQTCVFCAQRTGDDAPTGKPKCDHGPGATCLQCQDSGATGKKIDWLCTHPAGQKCVNCIKVTKKWKSKKRECRHPPHMKCPECIGGGDGEDGGDGGDGGESATNEAGNKDGGKVESKEDGDGAEAPAPSRTLTKYCRHPRTGMCEHCMPKPAEGSTIGGIPLEPPRCRSHGPHGSCINCLEWREARKHRIKMQKKPHVRAVSICRDAARVFQQQLQDTAFTHHRCGHMYGRATPKGTRVDAIYEPPQEGSDTGVALLPDPRLAAVDAVAASLGMERVGFVFSHPRRDGEEDGKLPMSGAELAIAAGAHASAHCDKGFVVVAIKPDPQGKSSFEAFQLSDQVVIMQRQGIIAPVEAQRAGPLGRLLVSEPVFVEGAETNEADVHFFVSPTAILDHRGGFLADFPVENRPNPVSMAHLRSHLVNHENIPFVGRLRDFHLLVFLSQHLDVKTDMPLLCKAVKEGDAEAVSGFQIIIESFSSMG